MKVKELVHQARRTSLPPMQQAILRYLETHPGEVFLYRDPNLAKALSLKPSAVSFSLWALAHKGLIGTVRVGRRVYFGSEKAIAQAGRLLGSGRQPGRDPMDEIRAVRERIKARTGLVDGLALLEESRARH